MLCPKGFSLLTYLESCIVLTPDKRENRRPHAVQGPVLRIAQIAPLYESVPPRLYGGTERVVSNLTEELVKLGHEVTLFASGDSLTSARLVSPCSSSLRLNAK